MSLLSLEDVGLVSDVTVSNTLNQLHRLGGHSLLADCVHAS